MHQPIESLIVSTTCRATASVQRPKHLIGLLVALALVLAIPTGARAQSADTIADAIDRDGYYTEDAADSDLLAAIERANDLGIAFVRLESTGGVDAAAEVAGDVWDELDGRGSAFRLVVVLIEDGYFIEAPTDFDITTLDEADLAALSGFSTNNDAEGLDAFTSAIAAGIGSGSSNSNTTPTTSGGTSGSEGSGGGLGLGSILLPLILIGGGFLLFRSWRGPSPGRTRGHGGTRGGSGRNQGAAPQQRRSRHRSRGSSCPLR